MVTDQDKATLAEANVRAMSANLALQAVMMRLSRGWTLESLAAKTKLPLSKLQRLEHGKVLRLSCADLAAIAVAYDMGLFARLTDYPLALQTALTTDISTTYAQEAANG